MFVIRTVRWAIAAVLIFVTVVSGAGAILTAQLRDGIQDQPQFITATTALAQDEYVHSFVARHVSEAALNWAKAEPVTIVGEQLQQWGQQALERVLRDFTESEAFARIWPSTMTSLHQSLLSAVEDPNQDEITIDLSAVWRSARPAELSGVDLGTIEVAVVSGAPVTLVREGVQKLDTLATVLLIVTLAGGIALMFVAPGFRGAMRAIGIALAGVGALLVLPHEPLAQQLADRVDGGQVPVELLARVLLAVMEPAPILTGALLSLGAVLVLLSVLLRLRR